MTFRFSYTPEDLRHAAMIALRRRYRSVPVLGFLLAPILIAAGCVILAIHFSWVWWFVTAIPLLWMLATWRLYFVRLSIDTPEYWQGQLSRANDLAVTADDDGLELVSDLETSRYSWNAFDRIDLSPDLILLDSATLVLALPRRALPPPLDAQFLTLARQRLAQRSASV